MSISAKPGNYTLALGIETQSVSVWSMISVEVLSPSPANTVPFLELAALGLAVALVALTLVLLRRRGSHRAHG